MLSVFLIVLLWIQPMHLQPLYTKTIICGNITTTNITSLPVEENPGGIRVTLGQLEPVHLISGATYKVELFPSLEMETARGIFVNIGDSIDDSVSSCPFNLSNITLPLSLLWKPDSNITSSVEIRAVIVVNESFWLTLSTTLHPSPDCVEYFTKPYGVIASPGFPSKYTNSINCTHIILVDSNDTLSLQMNILKMEDSSNGECLNYVEVIYDNQTSGRLCGKYNTTQYLYTTQSNMATVKFISNGNNSSGPAFQLFYYTKNVFGCNATLRHINGTVTSPTYPSDYPPVNRRHCVTHILLPVNFRVYVTITNLSLELNNCLDALIITDHVANKSRKWCAGEQFYEQKEIHFQSTSSEISVTFISESLVRNSGFSLWYRGQETCENQTFNANHGVLASTKISQNYANNENCYYNINVDDAPGGIVLKFSKFQTESDNDERRQIGPECNKDYLELTINGQTQKICGDWSGQEDFLTFRSYKPEVTLRFVSDDVNTRKGFSLEWQTISLKNNSTCATSVLNIDNTCFEVVYEARSWRESERDCRSRGGHLMSVLNVKQQEVVNEQLLKSSCSDQTSSFWIGANDIQYESDFYWTRGSKVTYADWFRGWPDGHGSKSQPSDDGLSNEDCVELRRSFRHSGKESELVDRYMWNDRDCAVNNFYICQCYTTGFLPILDVPKDCDQNVHLDDVTSSVEIHSPNYPNNYSNFLDCHVVVTAPPSLYLVVEFTDFYVEPSVGCTYDYLSISMTPFELQDNSSVKLCGDWIDMSKLLNQRISSNVVYMRFMTDNSRTFRGFKLKVSARKGEDRCESPSLPGDRGLLVIHQNRTSLQDARHVCQDKNGELWRPLTTAERFLGATIYLKTDLRGGAYHIWIEDRTMLSMAWQTKMINNVTLIPTNITIVTGSQNQSLPFICQKPCPVSPNQHEVLTMNTSQGTITVPEQYGGVYQNNLDLYWKVKVANRRIILTVVELDVEYQVNCLYDYFMINDSDQTIKLCGNLTKPRHILSSDDELNLRFFSDGSIGRAGVKVQWKAVNMEMCSNFRLTNESGIFSSFNFGLPFAADVNCVTTIIGEVGSRVLLTFTSLIPPVLADKLACSVAVDIGGSVLCVSNMTIEGKEFISSGNVMKILYRGKELRGADGFKGSYSTVDTSGDVVVKTRQELEVDDGIILYSLNYPYHHTDDYRHTTLISAPLRYKLLMTFTFTGLNRYNGSCINSTLVVTDVSFGDQYHKQLVNLCEAIKNNGTSAHNPTLNIESEFHQVELDIRYSQNRYNSLYRAFTVNISTILDVDFLEATRRISNGVLESCVEDTCLNNSTCKSITSSSYTCHCSQFYTGLLCQVTWCQLDPCDRGTCRHDSSNYQCDCHHGNWGRHCQMTSQECSISMCNGNGQCTGSASNPTCRCQDLFKGLNCSQAIVVLTPQSSISDILMSEPIWIGLIVILSVLCLFGIFYLIRRKCGKYFKCCEPNKKKTTTKDNKKDKPDVNETTFSSDTYSVEKSLQKFTNIPPILITPYTPVPEPANEGRKIAKRFFASYNGAGTSPISTPVTTDFIQNTATFLSEPADDKNGEIVGGRLLLDHLKVKSTTSLPRKSASLDPTSASLNRDVRMKRSHSTGPYLVRQETQFDDYALGGTINNGFVSSSTDHIYPNVIVAQTQTKADGDEADPKLDKDGSDRLCPSPNFLSVNHAKLHETRSIDGLKCAKREDRFKKEFLESYHRISKSLDVPTTGWHNLEPRKIKIMEDNYQCPGCKRSVSEHNYHHHHHRHQRKRHDDYQSRSFDDRLPGYCTKCDCCNHRPDPERRRRHRREAPCSHHDSYRDDRYMRRGSSTDSDRYKKYKLVSHRRARHDVQKRRSYEEREREDNMDMARLEILRKFLSQDLTDFYVDDETDEMNKYIESYNRPLNLDSIHPILRSSVSDPVKVHSPAVIRRESHSEPASVTNNKRLIAPTTSVLSTTDSDSALSSFNKSFSPSPHRPLTQVDSDIKQHLRSQDSAYQTKQSSVEQNHTEFSGILEENRRTIGLSNRSEDKKVSQRLHQAAIKLFVLQQRHRNIRFSRDLGAVHTISEDDYGNAVEVLEDRISPVADFSEIGSCTGGQLLVTPIGDDFSDLKEEVDV